MKDCTLDFRGFSIMKKCKTCKEIKFLSEFHKNKYYKDGLNYFCKECSRERTKKYKKTKEGLVSSIYGSQRQKSKLRGHKPPNYTNLELRDWMFSQTNFKELYDNYINNDYDVSLKPSCDRIDDYKGYSFDNIRLVTWGENQKRYYNDVKNGINNKRSKAIMQYTLDGVFIKEYYSHRKASRETGISASCICYCCNGTTQRAGGFKWKTKTLT